MIVNSVDEHARSAGDALFESVFESELAYVCRTLRRLGTADSDVEDLAHEVFVTVYRKLSSYDTNRPIRPWLFGIAFRVAAGFRRLARHHSEVLGTDHEAGRSDPVVKQVEARDLVLHALSALSWDQRVVFVAHEIDGHPIPEVARMLDIPLNTAYSRLRAARSEFKQKARESQMGGEP